MDEGETKPFAELGPLPKADAAGALQRESLVAFESVLPPSDFVFRRELEHDLGVDGSLELLLGGLATNMRAQLQLKARSGTQENKDGSVSVSIDTANLNHLLNGCCPIYVLYRAEHRELRYAFARDEWKRIEKRKPDWMKTSEITVRFAERLDESALQKIQSRVVKEALLQRKLWERLVRLAPAAGQTVTVDAHTLEVSDSVALAQHLASQGIQLVTAGRARLVIEKGRNLPSAAFQQEPLLSLILAFAEYAEGRYSESEGCLRDALSREANLDPDNRSLGWYLHHSIRFATGQIDRAGFFKAMEHWQTDAPAHLVSQYNLVRCWETYNQALAQANSIEVDEASKRLRVAVSDQKLDSLTQNQESQFLRLQLDAQELTSAHIDHLAQADLRGKTSSAWNKQWLEWSKMAELLSAEASARGNMRLSCEVELLLVHVQLMIVRHEALLRRETTAPVASLQQRVEGILDVARSIRSTQLELQAQLELAEIIEVSGDRTGARSLALEVYKQADLSRYAGIMRVAERQARGEGDLTAKLAELDNFRNGDGAATFLRTMGEEQLRNVAYDMCKSLGVPTSRSENVLQSLVAEKLIEEEKVKWCKFLEYRESRPPNDDVGRLFANPTQKKLSCSLLGFSSTFPHESGSTVLRSFKRAYCEGCAQRTLT